VEPELLTLTLTLTLALALALALALTLTLTKPQARYYAWSRSCGEADARVDIASLQQARSL